MLLKMTLLLFTAAAAVKTGNVPEFRMHLFLSLHAMAFFCKYIQMDGQAF